jgi:hypothetical protein
MTNIRSVFAFDIQQPRSCWISQYPRPYPVDIRLCSNCHKFPARDHIVVPLHRRVPLHCVPLHSHLFSSSTSAALSPLSRFFLHFLCLVVSTAGPERRASCHSCRNVRECSLTLNCSPSLPVLTTTPKKKKIGLLAIVAFRSLR